MLDCINWEINGTNSNFLSVSGFFLLFGLLKFQGFYLLEFQGLAGFLREWERLYNVS